MLKVRLKISIEGLLNSIGKRFKDRFHRLRSAYERYHPGLPTKYVEFAVSVGWSFYLAAMADCMADMCELSRGLEGGYETCINSGLTDMQLELVESEDFEYVKSMTYDVASLMLEEIEPTSQNQKYLDFVQPHVRHAYQRDVIGLADARPMKSTEMPEIYNYILRIGMEEKVVTWLARNMFGQNTPKDLLAPLKAAMECTPKVINMNLPVELFNKTFNVQIAPDTYRNWIRGYSNRNYSEKELQPLIDDLLDYLTA